MNTITGKLAYETITVAKLQSGDTVQDINPLTNEVTHHEVQFVKPYIAPSGAKMWRVSLTENDQIGWATGAGKRFNRIAK